MSTKHFYQTLQPFSRFSEVMHAAHYQELPNDWWIIVSDVSGSTKAIEENRYKEVNLVGASSIVAVLNKLKGKDVPFVFGGDGATILAHTDDMPMIRHALIGAKRLARDVFDLELRIGAVPVAAINEQGASVQVAKFAISEKSRIAAIRGGGLQIAESLIKNESPEFAKYRILGELNNSSSDFSGLSCRWNPIKTRKGQMLTLLVLAREPATAAKTYEEFLQFLDSVLDANESHPAASEKIDRSPNYRGLMTEMKIQAMGQSILRHCLKLLQIFFEVLVIKFLFITGAKVKGWFTAEGYVRETSANTDFQKFDDMIRMVRDCSSAQIAQITAYLEEQRKRGHLFYGLHSSNEALMTCLVFQLDNHIHFVDGGDGGYALAAKQLKAQMKSR